MIKRYEVLVISSQPVTQGEDFFMYRLYSSRYFALFVAYLLSSFFPYVEYPTMIKVTQYCKQSDDTLTTPEIIKQYKLKQEDE